MNRFARMRRCECGAGPGLARRCAGLAARTLLAGLSWLGIYAGGGSPDLIAGARRWTGRDSGPCCTAALPPSFRYRAGSEDGPG